MSAAEHLEYWIPAEGLDEFEVEEHGSSLNVGRTPGYAPVRTATQSWRHIEPDAVVIDRAPNIPFDRVPHGVFVHAASIGVGDGHLIKQP